MVLSGGPVQVAYGVDNLDLAVERWSGLGCGPFVVRKHIDVADVQIFGEPGDFDHSSAFGWWGTVMVELIVVHSPLSLATTGLHHVAYFVDSLGEATVGLGERGWPLVLTARAGTTRFAFVDARPDLGHLVELYEPTPDLLAFYRRLKFEAESVPEPSFPSNFGVRAPDGSHRQ